MKSRSMGKDNGRILRLPAWRVMDEFLDLVLSPGIFISPFSGSTRSDLYSMNLNQRN
jgi:hypothetical protein